MLIRTLIFSWLISIPFFGSAQDLELIDGKYSMQSQQHVETDKEVFSNIRGWMLENFNSSDNKMVIDDSENGQLVAKGVIEVKAINESGKTVYKKTNYQLQASIKNSECLISISDLMIVGEPSASNFYKAFFTPAEDVLSDENLNKGSKKKRRFYNTLKEGIQSEFRKIILEVKEEAGQ